MKQLLGIFFTLTLLSACATPPTNQEFDTADFGTYPKNYEQVVQDYIERAFKDPYSAKVQYLNEPKKVWRKEGEWGEDIAYSYLVCADINAKNVLGAYTGQKLHMFWIRNDHVVKHQGDKYLVDRKLCLEN